VTLHSVSKIKFAMAPAEGKEDLANTPAERAAADAAAGKRLSLEEEALLFAAAEETSVGGDAGAMVVLGAGLVGALCALVLRRKGFDVKVYERYTDIRTIPSAGRSINLSVTSRGMRAIRALGGSIYGDMLKIATRINGRIIHMTDGKAVFQRYGKDDTECNYSISRIDLNKFLINAAAEEGVVFHFDHNLSETSDFSGDDLVGCTLHMTQGPPNKPSELKRLRMRVQCPVIACDGAGSRARYALRRSGLTDFTEDVLERGYKEVLFPKPADKSQEFGAPADGANEGCAGQFGLHIWPRGDHMLMALSNPDGSFTGTIYMDNEGSENSFAAMGNTLEGRAACTTYCEKYYGDAVPSVGGIDSMVRQVTENPTGILGTVHATNWAIKGKVLLIGDSAHAMVPFFGQGCNCGFEDTYWLSKLLDQYCGGADGRHDPAKCTGESFAQCFKAVEAERKCNADAICDMALENFLEMRDKTGDIRFQAIKKVENRIENAFPAKFRSRYAMVCYGGDGNVSYANAKALGLVQDQILKQLFEEALGDATTEEQLMAAVDKVDLVAAEKLIDSDLAPRHRELQIDLSTVKH